MLFFVGLLTASSVRKALHRAFVPDLLRKRACCLDHTFLWGQFGFIVQFKAKKIEKGLHRLCGTGLLLSKCFVERVSLIAWRVCDLEGRRRQVGYFTRPRRSFQHMITASRKILGFILDCPNSRSTNKIGISLRRNPFCRVRHVVSIWKE